jgi:hypothetical protein
MSEPLKVALVVEGPTDRVVIESAISRVLEERAFVPTQLQPEQSAAFGPFGAGWGGVFRWCQQAARRGGGCLSGDLLFNSFDVLVLHLDADVADSSYADLSIQDGFDDLPCAEPCPPPGATTRRLRRVLLGWAGETKTPRRIVVCIPSKSIEAWVLAALYPNDPAVQSGDLECLPDPEVRLGQQPIRRRIRKSVADYKNRSEALREGWPRVTTTCREAQRFSNDFRTVVNNEQFEEDG